MNAGFERLRAHLPEIAAALLAAVIATTIWLAVEYERQVGWVQHSLEVENSIGRLLSAAQDAETGNRGYIITGEDAYLGPYELALEAFDTELEGIRNLTADNPDQLSALDALAPVAAARFARLREGIELRQTMGLEAAADYVRSNQGGALMEDIRSIVAGMHVTEARLLNERLGDARRFSTAAALATLLGIGVVILSITAWIWNARRDAAALRATIVEREQAEARVRQMQKMEAVGQLTGGVAHDFNNMLAVIISALNLIQKRLAAGDTNIQRFVDAAMDGAQRAVAITSRLMAFSRQQPLAPQQLDANRLVTGMSDLIDRALGETIQVETVLAGGLWPTLADAAQLESAVLNLCVNARDAMAGGGKLTIETANCHLDDAYARQHETPAGQYVMLAVTDTGSGMPADVLARAFDPFFTTKAVGKGSGLGLSQVYGFVKQSGGHIKIYSEAGHGTTVKIYLPRLHNAVAGAPAPGRSAGTISIAPSAGEAAKLILVVEDDDRVRRSQRLAAARARLHRHPCRRCARRTGTARSASRHDAALHRHRHARSERPAACRRGHAPPARPQGALHHRLHPQRHRPPRGARRRREFYRKALHARAARHESRRGVAP